MKTSRRVFLKASVSLFTASMIFLAGYKAASSRRRKREAVELAELTAFELQRTTHIARCLKRNNVVAATEGIEQRMIGDFIVLLSLRDCLKGSMGPDIDMALLAVAKYDADWAPYFSKSPALRSYFENIRREAVCPSKKNFTDLVASNRQDSASQRTTATEPSKNTCCRPN